jgi:hypothetical protein
MIVPIVLSIATAAIVCCIFTAIIIIAYIVFNKPQETPAPLISDSLARDFARQQRQEDEGQLYSNVMNARIGFDNSIITRTQQNVDITVCKAICDSLRHCNGFQMHDNGTTCDLLSNISTTYSFEVQGWNFYMKDNVKQSKGFGAPVTNQAISGSMIRTLMPSVVTKEACAPLCKSNTTCTSFSVGPSGCSMHTSDAVKVPQVNTQIYKIKDI